MANHQHLKILEQGLGTWNHWRRQHPEIRPDLNRSNLGGAVLSGALLTSTNLFFANLKKTILFSANLNDANLTAALLNDAKANTAFLVRANLTGASLIKVDLDDANLTEANLNRADLSSANLRNANLRRTVFTDAIVRDANLRGAIARNGDFRGADLSFADLSYADLTEADFTGCRINRTIFGCNDLSPVKGLEAVQHTGPSLISLDTIYLSRGDIPEVFLRRAGVQDTFVTYMTSLIEQPIHYYSCFLSHAKEDGAFAELLRRDLVKNKVSCWHYRYDMQGGKYWRTQINEAIKLHEKLILVCSKRSLLRRNVVDEIVSAMERERETHSQRLFPVRLDDFILGDDILALADEKMGNGEWREDWVRYVRSYHIPDFLEWATPHAYQADFRNLLEALRHPAKR